MTNRVHNKALPLFSILLLFCNPWFAMASETTTYTIKDGESLWRICQKFQQDPNRCWNLLASLNQVSEPKQLPVGKTILIPMEWLPTEAAPILVKFVSGDITLIRKHESGNQDQGEKLTTASIIKLGDKIITAKNSSTLLVLADAAEILIKPNSEVIFNRLSIHGSSNMVDIGLQLNRGRVRSSGDALKNLKRLEIQTPSAVAAVRGTVFRVAVTGDLKTLNEVTEGLVDVQAQGNTVSVAQGFAISAKQGEPPSEPVKLLDAPSPTMEYKPNSTLVKWSDVEAVAYSADLYKEIGGIYTFLLNETLNTNSYILPKLSSGKYMFQVRGIDANGFEGFDGKHYFRLDK